MSITSLQTLHYRIRVHIKKKISFCFIFILFDFMVDKNYDGNYYLFDFNKVNK